VAPTGDFTSFDKFCTKSTLNVDLGWRQQISDLSDLHCTFKHNENNVQFIGRTEFCEENS